MSRTLEGILVGLDVGVPGAAIRVALGFLLVPALQFVRPEPTPSTLLFALLVALFGVKAVAAIARRVVPATDSVRRHWEWRRDLARYHDSYQWRKLLWVGVGLVAGASLGLPGTSSQWGLGAACVLAGCIAEAFWRRQGLALSPPGS